MTTTNRCLVDLDSLGGIFAERVATARELVHLGISSSTIYTRCRHGGPWRRLLPGIVLLSSTEPSRRTLVRAALRFGGPRAILTGHDALRLNGLHTARPGGPVHILVPACRQPHSDAAVRIERTARLPEPVLRQTFVTASVTRAVLDTARTLTSPPEVRAVLVEAVRRRLTTPDALRAELAAGSQRGSALPRAVLREFGDRVHHGATACSASPQHPMREAPR